MSDYQIPYLVQVSSPATEPLTLADAKLYLRVDGSDEDALITNLIRVAREHAEKYTRRSLITQSWMLAYDDYAPAKVFLPRGPVQSVSSVKLVARDATENTLSANSYYLNAGGEKLIFDVSPVGNIVEITYVTGFGDSTDVPQDIKQGMLAHIADLYEYRSTTKEFGQASLNFYAPYRVLGI